MHCLNTHFPFKRLHWFCFRIRCWNYDQIRTFALSQYCRLLSRFFCMSVFMLICTSASFIFLSFKIFVVSPILYQFLIKSNTLIFEIIIKTWYNSLQCKIYIRAENYYNGKRPYYWKYHTTFILFFLLYCLFFVSFIFKRKSQSCDLARNGSSLIHLF